MGMEAILYLEKFNPIDKKWHLYTLYDKEHKPICLLCGKGSLTELLLDEIILNHSRHCPVNEPDDYYNISDELRDVYKNDLDYIENTCKQINYLQLYYLKERYNNLYYLKERYDNKGLFEQLNEIVQLVESMITFKDDDWDSSSLELYRIVYLFG